MLLVSEFLLHPPKLIFLSFGQELILEKDKDRWMSSKFDCLSTCRESFCDSKYPICVISWVEGEDCVWLFQIKWIGQHLNHPPYDFLKLSLDLHLNLARGLTSRMSMASDPPPSSAGFVLQLSA